MNIGQLIRSRREALRLSQSDVEKKSGIKREYLSKIENGELGNPTINTIEKLASALDCTVLELFGGKNKNASDLELAKMQQRVVFAEAEMTKAYEALGVALDVINAQRDRVEEALKATQEPQKASE